MLEFNRLEKNLVLKGQQKSLLIVGLVLLLGVQLTGLTCLGEWQAEFAASLIEASDMFPSSDGTVTDDGCPCHLVFQSMHLTAPEIIVPLTDDVILSSTLYVPTFVVSLFHPPLNL